MSLVAQVPPALFILTQEGTQEGFALRLRELTEASRAAQACLPQAGFSLCAFVFVGAAFTPPVGAKRRAFVL